MDLNFLKFELNRFYIYVVQNSQCGVYIFIGAVFIMITLTYLLSFKTPNPVFESDNNSRKKGRKVRSSNIQTKSNKKNAQKSDSSSQKILVSDIQPKTEEISPKTEVNKQNTVVSAPDEEENWIPIKTKRQVKGQHISKNAPSPTTVVEEVKSKKKPTEMPMRGGGGGDKETIEKKTESKKESEIKPKEKLSNLPESNKTNTSSSSSKKKKKKKVSETETLTGKSLSVRDQQLAAPILESTTVKKESPITVPQHKVAISGAVKQRASILNNGADSATNSSDDFELLDVTKTSSDDCGDSSIKPKRLELKILEEEGAIESDDGDGDNDANDCDKKSSVISYTSGASRKKNKKKQKLISQQLIEAAASQETKKNVKESLEESKLLIDSDRNTISTSLPTASGRQHATVSNVTKKRRCRKAN